MAQTFKLKGRIYEFSETEQKSDNFRKREMIVETDDEYSPFVKMQLIQKNVDLPEQLSLKPGDDVSVTFALGGRRGNNGNIWTNITALFIDVE